MNDNEDFPRSLEEIRTIVRESLPEKYDRMANTWTHISGGCETGSTWRRSIEAFEGLGFVQKGINPVVQEKVDLSVNILGTKWELPIGIAPMSGVIASVCENTFREMATAVGNKNIAASVGYPAGPEIHKKMVETGAAVFRIVKPIKDIEKIKEALKIAQEAGCFAAGIDTDSVAGLKAGDNVNYKDTCDPISMDVLKEIRESIEIPFIIKGVLSEEDARASMELGADAIVVSTHGGSALDYSPSSLEVLPDIVRVVDHKMKVLFDSGIRRGSDIVKALALGADAVLIGRMALWGLVLGKAKGLEWILELLADEMRRIMVLLGAEKIGDLDRKALVPLNHIGDRILKP
jgi:isopentenyl diphosphate isomerase/L-lactate dehydrogenase-like FMN-dependent dehydrogenase